MPSHFEHRLQQDRDRISAYVADAADLVDRALHDALKAILRRDADLAAKVILNDHPINRLTRRIDGLCNQFLVRHQPSAGHLRYVSSVVRLMVALERLGDYAVTIAREAVQLAVPVPERLARDIEMLGDEACTMLKQAMDAFQRIDASAADATKAVIQASGTVFDNTFADLVDEARSGDRPTEDVFALLLVHNRLARVRDQAKNICEEATFAATGKTKTPKVYRVLFADRANTLRSTMAEAIARTEFPGSGVYTSAGATPAATCDAAVIAFLERRGCDVSELRPRELRTCEGDLNDHHIVVCLEPGVRDRIPHVPFHTVLVEWKVGPTPEEAQDMTGEDLLARLHADLSERIRHLMVTLRGPDAG